MLGRRFHSPIFLMLAVDVLDTRNDLLVRVSVGFQPLDQPQGLALGHAVVHRPPSFLTGASRALRDHYTAFA